jgi:hypothetical protein
LEHAGITNDYPVQMWHLIGIFQKSFGMNLLGRAYIENLIKRETAMKLLK